jgi:hypothetical protein
MDGDPPRAPIGVTQNTGDQWQGQARYGIMAGVNELAPVVHVVSTEPVCLRILSHLVQWAGYRLTNSDSTTAAADAIDVATPNALLVEVGPQCVELALFRSVRARKPPIPCVLLIDTRTDEYFDLREEYPIEFRAGWFVSRPWYVVTVRHAITVAVTPPPPRSTLSRW